ncbi:MAG: hypothetical protein AVO38_01240 [delta proteobacterium ML8_D]|nr:MAG: hypothetical protein AVO38_01240 [delta proteobacterium ML8_D]
MAEVVAAGLNKKGLNLSFLYGRTSHIFLYQYGRETSRNYDGPELLIILDADKRIEQTPLFPPHDPVAEVRFRWE